MQHLRKTGGGGTAVALLMKNFKCMETPPNSRRLSIFQRTPHPSVFPPTPLPPPSTFPPPHLLALFNFRYPELARPLHRHFRREIENHAPFNVPLDGDERRTPLPAIRILIHREVHDLRRRLQQLRKYRIRGTDERLDQFH